ncbi:hypothetical protein JCM10207_008599 [Rhodosporidiobolus poonsookiae]
MASFSSLPAELVERIVELAVPPFEPWGWKERLSTLRALSTTCKATSGPALRLLFRQVFLTTSQTGQDFARSLLAFPSAQQPAVRQLEIRCTDWQEADLWVAEAPNGDFALLPLILRLSGYKHVKLDNLELVDAVCSTHALQAQELLLSNLRFDPLLPPLTFSALKRLGLYHVDCDDAHHLLRSDVLPNLVTLAFINISTSDAHPFLSLTVPSGSQLGSASTPLFHQLKAFSSEIFQRCPAATSHRVHDAYLTRGLLKTMATLPHSLSVLRLVADDEDSDDNSGESASSGDLLYDLVRALDSPSFRPSLQELHLVNFVVNVAIEETGLGEIRDWGKRKAVRLFFDHPADLDENFRPFVLAVPGRDRLGLDV